MFINRTGFIAVTLSARCVQICKQTRSWRFRSNVSKVSRKNIDLQVSDKNNLKRDETIPPRFHDSDNTNEVTAAYSSIPKKTNTTRISDEEAARIIVNSAKKVFHKKDVILEFDAGSGLLSNALLCEGIKNLVALEPQQPFGRMLKTIKQQHEKSFNYFFESIRDVLSYSDDEFSSNLPGVNINNEVQIIGHVPSWHLLLEISRRLRDHRSFLFKKSVNLCLCLPENTWNQFLDNRVQKMCVVERILFQVAFDYKILATLPRKHFHITMMKKDLVKLKPNDNMVLIHIKSKPTKDFDLTELQVFLTQFHNCSSRNRLVIPSLEQWSPSCGEELVKQGMLVFTRFSDLEPKDLLKVFLYFKSLPNVEASEFLSEWKTDFES